MDRQQLLRQFRNLDTDKFNEAETRLKIINEVIFNLLGWLHDDVTVEERVIDDGKNTYTDYILRTAATAIVIEAKKSGDIFDILPGQRRIPLRGKILQSKTGSTIKQARTYAQQSGIQFAVVTNGIQWIIFPAMRIDQVTFSDSSCIIFDGLESFLDTEFGEFSDLLSRQSVISGKLEDHLLGRHENQLRDHRINSHFPNSFSKFRDDSLYKLIEPAIVRAFSEETILSDPDLLDSCYVQTPERVRFDQRIRMHIEHQEVPTKRPPKRPMKKGRDRNHLPTLIENSTKSARPVAILILGTVGCGKTTFLHYTRTVSAKNLFERSQTDLSQAYWFHIDYRDFSASDDPNRFLVQQLRELIEQDDFLSDYDKCVKEAYRDQFDALFRGPLKLLAEDDAQRREYITKLLMEEYQAYYPYIEKIFRYITKTKPVFLIVDNVDQFDEIDVQNRIFSSCVAYSRTISANLVLCMREVTYVQHRTRPTFDAFDFDTIKIDPPILSSVLSKRLNLARTLLENQSASFQTESGVRFQISNLAQVIDMLQPSILGTRAGELIDVLAASDIRLALRMVREFLQYGYTATGRALEIYQRTGRYILPSHEALRAIMLGSQTVYSDSNSILMNPLDTYWGRNESQFLRLFVLCALVNSASQNSAPGVPGSEIRDSLIKIGFSEDMCEMVIKDLTRGRLIITNTHVSPDLRSTYFATRLSGYIVKQLLMDFTFLENLLGDTFIEDENVWSDLYSLTEKIFATRDIVSKLKVRKSRVEKFYEFCTGKYQVLHDESVRRGLPSRWCMQPFEMGRMTFNENIRNVMSSAQRNYG